MPTFSKTYKSVLSDLIEYQPINYITICIQAINIKNMLYAEDVKKVWYFCPCKKVAIVSQWDKLASLKEMRKLELFIICFEIKKASLQLSPYTSQEVQKGTLFGFIGTEKVHYHCSFIPFLFINNLMIIELTWK